MSHRQAHISREFGLPVQSVDECDLPRVTVVVPQMIIDDSNIIQLPRIICHELTLLLIISYFYLMIMLLKSLSHSTTMLCSLVTSSK